jgi:predicted alpha/beta hydrolase
LEGRRLKTVSGELSIPATDGFPLAATLLRGRGCERRLAIADGQQQPGSPGALIIAGAVGNIRQNYEEYARYMSAQGWDVIRFDYRGIGESKAGREQTAAFSMLDWAEKDLSGVIDWAQKRLQPRRLVLVGHSIGGQLAGLAPNNDQLTALVAVAAQRGYWPYWDGWRKYAIYLFWRLYLPLCVSTFGRLPMKAMELEDLPGGIAREWARWGLHRHYKDADGNLLWSRFARFTAPILAMSFSDDQSLAPRRAVDALFTEHYVGAPLTRWHFGPEDFGGLGHSGFFSRQTCPERLWEATSEWILGSCPGGLPAAGAFACRNGRGKQLGGLGKCA